jgi:hypothetical protein
MRAVERLEECGRQVPRASARTGTTTTQEGLNGSELVESYRAFGLSPKEAAMAANIENAIFSARRSQ